MFLQNLVQPENFHSSLRGRGRSRLTRRPLASRMRRNRCETAPAKLENDALPPGDTVPHRDFWYPAQRFASRVDPRARNRDSQPVTVDPVSVPIEIVHRGGISFHAGQSVWRSRALGIIGAWPCFARGEV